MEEIVVSNLWRVSWSLRLSDMPPQEGVAIGDTHLEP